MQAVFSSEVPAIGIHDLRPLGPWPLPGTVPSKDGRVPGVWGCTRCSRSAGNTSRAKVLARQPCSGAAWAATPAVHSLELDGEHWRCSRCLLKVRPQHAAQSGRQSCPVPELTLAGNRWSSGEAGLREVLGRLRAFRHFCNPDEVAVDPAAAQARPAAVAAAAAGTVPQQQPEQQLCLVQLAEVPAEAAEEAGPLARAANADCRRQLKRAEAAPAAAAAVAAPAAVGAASEAVFEPPAPHDRPLSPCSVPASFVLQPYAQHKVVFVGRNLWCLDCFEVPRSSHRSWRHGRCGGARSPTFMPPALRDGIRRQGAACPKLHAGTVSRWAVPAGALGLH